MVLREEQKNAKETELYHITFLQSFTSNNNYPTHDTIICSTYIYFTVFCIYLDQSLNFYVRHKTGVFGIIVLK